MFYSKKQRKIENPVKLYYLKKSGELTFYGEKTKIRYRFAGDTKFTEVDGRDVDYFLKITKNNRNLFRKYIEQAAEVFEATQLVLEDDLDEKVFEKKSHFDFSQLNGIGEKTSSKLLDAGICYPDEFIQKPNEWYETEFGFSEEKIVKLKTELKEMIGE